MDSSERGYPCAGIWLLAKDELPPFGGHGDAQERRCRPYSAGAGVAWSNPRRAANFNERHLLHDVGGRHQALRVPDARIPLRLVVGALMLLAILHIGSLRTVFSRSPTTRLSLGDVMSAVVGVLVIGAVTALTLSVAVSGCQTPRALQPIAIRQPPNLPRAHLQALRSWCGS